MEETIWKARVTSTRMIERMKFLRAYWGRSTLTAKLWAPDREYPITQVLMRCVERVYDEVIKDLEARAKRPAEPFMLHEGAKAEWWLKMAYQGRNGDPFPGVTYSAGLDPVAVEMGTKEAAAEEPRWEKP